MSDLLSSIRDQARRVSAAARCKSFTRRCGRRSATPTLGPASTTRGASALYCGTGWQQPVMQYV
ncbi:Hypothetical protein CAP_3879 [Chondromyces apiculatus DSM 436]|uniref:Uncharacterized protein n=1 Tax=Chondromyces apiculatus DSM 436 TaxID=1192034 RepID=A0A017T6F5_9BACT|nr:Hypothetical protein CAP_3879 [Chondromyces apiculatus DSM 436]